MKVRSIELRKNYGENSGDVAEIKYVPPYAKLVHSSSLQHLSRAVGARKIPAVLKTVLTENIKSCEFNEIQSNYRSKVAVTGEYVKALT
jgi:hypothetical protein